MKLLQRLKNLWSWSELAPYEFLHPTPETVEEWAKMTEPFVPQQGNGKAEYLPMMSEEEMTAYLKETDLGWKKIYDKVRSLGKPDDA